ncbi:cadherin domain-containing protein [Chitinophaga sp. Cy-1792]|uniref:cadherin domain-containing protein n=1 Tax=Chitinophaga sp. Cy-1792 TaxID=2608339 RepID=UPI00141F2A77|nr:cadherin domain-containing protein [Chitinophaga sp. Cy-1792]
MLLQYFLLTVVPAHATPLARVTAPTITNVTGPTPAKSYKKGDVLSFTITFSVPVKVTGAPGSTYVQLYLGAPGKARQAVWVSSAASATQVFSYTLTDGDDFSGTVTWDNFITINAGNIFDTNTPATPIDPNGLKANFQAGATTSAAGIIIDATSPFVADAFGNPDYIHIAGAQNVASGSDVQFLVTFSEPVQNITKSGWVAAGSNALTFSSYDVVVTGIKTCVVTFHNVVNTDTKNVRTFQIQLNGPASGITDNAGNPMVTNAGSDAFYIGPGTPAAPTPIITVENNKTKVNGDFNITVTFSNTLQAFDPTKLSCTNCNATFTGTAPGGPYTYTISPQGNTGTATISLPVGAGQDAFGQNTTASNTVTVAYDKVQPTVQITPSQDAATGTFSAVLVFSKPVTTPDITKLTGTSGTVTLTQISLNDRTTYKVVFTPAAQEMDINFGVSAGASKDDYGNDNLPANVIFHFDVLAPTIISITPTTASPTNATAVTYQVKFSEKVTQPQLSDFLVMGTVTANGVMQSVVPVGGTAPATDYIVTIGSVGGDGTLNLGILGNNSIQDPSNNPLSGTANGTPVTIDHTPPTVNLSGATIFGQDPFTVQLHFSEPVVQNTGSITIANGTLGVISKVDAQNWTVTVSAVANGAVVITLNTDSWRDLAGNPLQQTAFNVNFDNTVPQPTLTKEAGYDAPFKVDIQFSTDFYPNVLDNSMFTLTNGTISSLYGSGRNWVVVVQPIAPGPVSIFMQAARVKSAAGIKNAASNVVTWTYDPGSFDVTLSTSAPDPAVNTFDVAVELTKAATTLDASMFTLVNGTVYNVTKVDDTHFTVSVKPAATGSVSVTFSANQLQDAGGRPNNISNTVTVNGVVNHPPTDINLSKDNVDENMPAGTLVGNLTATDPDAGDQFIYTLMPGYDAGFAISGNQLVTTTPFDYETKNSYNIRIKVTDKYGATFEKNFTIYINNVNEAPADILLSNNTIAEDKAAGTSVGTFSATDPENNVPLTYTLVAGVGSTDNASFIIAGDVLQSGAMFNYNTKNTYNIRVRVTDALGAYFEKTFVINVTAVNHAPTGIVLTPDYIVDHSPAYTKVGVLTAIDVDQNETFHFTILSGFDGSKFKIVTVGTDTYLELEEQAEYYQQNSYTVMIEVTDNGGAVYSQKLTIPVKQGNYPPTAILLDNTKVDEGLPVGTTVGNLSGTDPNPGDHLHFSIVASPDAGKFDITGGTTLVTNAVFDYSVKSSYDITIRATDDGGLYLEKTFTIYVNNKLHPATDIALDRDSVPENSPVGTLVGNLSATSIDPVTYTFGGGADDAQFTISGTTLLTNASFDYETKKTYQIKITATNTSGLTFTKDFTIKVTNVNENPTDISLDHDTVEEQQAAGAVVGNLSTTDPDTNDTFTYTIQAGPDAANFAIDGNVLKTAAVLDFRTKATYTITIRSTDAGGLYTEKSFTIHVSEKNLPPDGLELSNTRIDEGLPLTTVVGTIIGHDPNTVNILHYSIVPVDDYSYFSVNGDKLITMLPMDYSVKSQFHITLTVMDQFGLSFQKQFTITVNNKYHGPSGIQLSKDSIPENSAIGTLVGNLSANSVDAASTLVYSFGGGADDASFTINGTALNSNTALDFETKNTYNIKIKVTDTSGLSSTQDFVIRVTDVNEAPTSLALSNNKIDELLPLGSTVGTLSATDPDAGDTFTYTIVGGADANSFKIVNNVLQTNAVLNYQQQQTYEVRIRVTDRGGLYFEQTFTIQLLPVNQAPTDVQLSNTQVEDQSPANTVVGKLTATDPDANETFTYTLSGTDAGKFKVVLSGSDYYLQTVSAVDMQQQSSYSITITVTDRGGLTYGKPFTITVKEKNVAPTDIQLSKKSVDEQLPAGTTVGTITGTDPNTNDQLSFSLLAGGDNNSFAINGTTLVTNAVFDFSVKSQYVITIRATDLGGLTYEKQFTITVNNTGHPPTAIALSNNSVAENSAVGTLVGNLSATSVDPVNSLVYSFAGGADDAQFTISGTELKTNAVFDYETKNVYNIKIKVTGGSGLSYTKDFTINVTDVNEAPTDITLDNNKILENSPVGTAIGSFTATDPDAGDTFTWSFAGGADDSKFTLVGNKLQSNAVFDYETKNSYTIRIRVTDRGGLYFEKNFTINILDVNEPPTITNPGNQVVCDGQQAQEIALSGLSAGPEKNQTITIVATSSKDFFDMLTTRDNGNGTGAIRFQLKKGISGVTTLTVLVRDNGGTDNGGQDQVSITFDLTVNELPAVTVTSDKGTTVPAGTIVNLTATGGSTYAWGDAPDVISGRNSAVLTVQPTVTNTYLVTVTNVYGCTVTTDFRLEVSGKVGVEASNILTPNGDGINDRWVVKNIAQYPNNEVRIYDRAGRLIYNRKGYANEWDGRLNGHVLAEGTYYYLLDLGDGKVVKGFITIVHQ